MYWMTNPLHGVMPVYDLSDVERVKGHGWSLLNEGPSPLREAPKEKEDKPSPPDSDNPPAKRKPGRPKKA
jgi:hypothetical protein